jgi:hypothetical protein
MEEKEKPSIELDKVQKILEEANKETLKTVGEIKKILELHEKTLQEITQINRTVEDTLLNVLLAIKQNTFLQAWYPSQAGHPEIHVIGSHPERTAV